MCPEGGLGAAAGGVDGPVGCTVERGMGLVLAGCAAGYAWVVLSLVLAAQLWGRADRAMRARCWGGNRFGV